MCIPHLCAGTGHFSKEPWFLLLERFTEVRKALGGQFHLQRIEGTYCQHDLNPWMVSLRLLHCDVSSTLISLKGSSYAAAMKELYSTSLAERRATYIWNLEFFCVGSWYIPHLLIYSHICLYTSVVFVFSVYFVVCNPILLIKLFHLWPLSRVLWAFLYVPINVFVLCF